MVEPYLEVAIFFAVSVFVPAAMLLFSWLVRPKTGRNEVQEKNYESAEEPVGTETAVMAEYSPYFVVFLMFELLSLVVLLWAIDIRSMSKYSGYFIFLLPVFSIFLSWLILSMARHRV
ncbi:MAG: NADH-quinone oxidoreductase subunit A [Candidatus Micrarchaeia archaeon]